MKHRRQRRNATLIELIISLGLAAVLLSTLFGYYFQANKIHQETKKSFTLLYLQYSLHQQFLRTLAKISFRDTSKKEGGYCFSSSLKSTAAVNQSLIFTFDNGIDDDQMFSADVLARIYVDEDRHLILATWPNPLRWSIEESQAHSRQEILLEEVQSLNFTFYKPPFDDQGKKQVDTKENWFKDWEKDMPSMIRIQITYKFEGKEKTFDQIYPLEHAELFPSYHHQVNHEQENP